jgi:hypothetical protein
MKIMHGLWWFPSQPGLRRMASIHPKAVEQRVDEARG